jgi:hypothetical protein
MFAFGHVKANLLVGDTGSRHAADRFLLTRSAIVEPGQLGAAGGKTMRSLHSRYASPPAKIVVATPAKMRIPAIVIKDFGGS